MRLEFLNDELLSQLQSGAWKLVNGALIDTDGNLVGILQEASGFASSVVDVTAFTGEPISLAFKLGQTGFSLYKQYNLNNLFGQVLLFGKANLVLNSVGIGVSVIGFALVIRKLNQVNQNMQQVLDSVESLRTKVEARDMATIESLLYQAEEAQHRQGMDSILTDLIVKLDLEERYYRYQVQKIRTDSLSKMSDSTLQVFQYLLELQQTLFSTRLNLLFQLNDLKAAHMYLENCQLWYQQQFQSWSTLDVCLSRRHREEKIRCLEWIRIVESNFITKGRLIDMLKEARIGGLKYMKTLERVTKSHPYQPLYILRA